MLMTMGNSDTDDSDEWVWRTALMDDLINVIKSWGDIKDKISGFGVWFSKMA